MDVKFLIITLLFLLSSCMPTASVSNGNLSGSDGGNGNDPDTSSGVTTPKWNFLGTTTTTITINVSNLNSAYIIGDPVESYLASSANFTNQNYCVVASFSIAGVPKELRSRVVPISYYDFTAKRTVRVLRVDFQDVDNSTANCNSTLRVLDTSGNYVVDTTTPPTYNFDPNALCSTCTGNVTATKVRLFKKGTTYLDQVSANLISTASLYLAVNPNYSSGGNAGTCTNSSCQASGYNCCLDNQCVNDGATRPSAYTQYASLLQTAEAERLQNPLAYLNYPQLYYICGSATGGTTGSSAGGTSSGSTGGSGGYDTAFELLKKDRLCIEHIKSQATSNPFHLELLTKTYTAGTDCLTSSSDSAQTMYYQSVVKRLYTTCGCSFTNLSDMISNCPAYDYTVVSSDTSGTPLQIDCYTPPTNTTPSTNQTVNVSSRSAPHRFFESNNGIEKDILGNEKTYTSSGVTHNYEQEGEKFEYLDEEKILPNQQNFSMNAILGQMSVSLDKALPAKSIAVEYDQSYIIATTSGYYTPCPTCSRDSWLSSLTAFPSSSFGTGLQAVGHTTERDSLSTNTTGGNYEDTIFGRACWLPPTMLPYSHTGKSLVKDQRKARLETQAALYSNGYQRDWFGFNKGALIGSFDGVTWFAIGKGRVVKATSKKLFLAINAPFADVATASYHVVNVSLYDGVSMAASVDYDPQYSQYHSYQNEAGNCQKYHMCSTDTDCVTKLGWEYACADVKDLRTSWPSFDQNGNESGTISSATSIDQILQQKKYPSSSTKRCVYRGAGSVCLTNSNSITDTNKRKLLSCAPNFFCANVSQSLFNNKVSRYASNLEDVPVSRNHLFGKDANVLGRPLDYTASNSLTSDIRTNLIANVRTMENSLGVSNTGLCQPGKALPTASTPALANPYSQQATFDSSRRTDFINQIGSCNSTNFSSTRHSSCPVIGTDGNLDMFAATLPTDYSAKATTQNACGLESLISSSSLGSSADTLQSYSPFRDIEARPLNSQIIVNKSLVRDACLRRAGAVCHTDLDCSPNKLHADVVENFSLSYFGNAAEKTYYSEYLVCGQADPKPYPSDTTAFNNYDMSKNLCCREVGKDLTTYTSDLPTAKTSGSYNADSVGLKMSVAPGIAPNDPKRYSRLATVQNIGTSSERPILTAYQERNPATGVLTTNSQGANVLTSNQWKTLSEANSETCCGGGWIRKFSDGTNDWTRRNRVYVDVQNFACINSRTPLITDPSLLSSQYSVDPTIFPNNVQSLVDADYGDYCKDNTNTTGACAQFSVTDSSTDTGPDAGASNITYTNITVNTISPVYSGTNGDYYFTPRSADGDTTVFVDYANSSASARRNIAIRIPSYVTRDFDNRYNANTLTIQMVGKTGAGVTAQTCTKNTGFVPVDHTVVWGGAGCVYSYNHSNRVLYVGASAALGAGTFANRQIGVQFTTPTPGNGIAGLTRTKPGTNSYYLRRLGRLELSGIPQVTFEPLYCNDSSTTLVPGIFNTTVLNKNQFESPVNSFRKTSLDTVYQTSYHGLQVEPVFSQNDFKCCSPLGKTVSNTSRCCSGYGVRQGTSGSSYTCALPAGTDLMVYFNSYVSNEGRKTSDPGGGLLETDFDATTGEPLITATINDKIRALGLAYCSSGKVRQGGAFGSFEPEPQGSDTNLSGRIYNIVDSSRDSGITSNAGTTVTTGYTPFMDGFRWNHHLYCND